MSFAVVIEGMTTIAYIVIMAGGKQKRESGWKVLTGLHAVVALLLGASLSIIVSLLPRTYTHTHTLDGSHEILGGFFSR